MHICRIIPLLVSACMLIACGNVTFTLPKDYEPMTTNTNEYPVLQQAHTFTTNADGSFTYEVDSEQQKALLAAVRTDFEDTRSKWLANKALPLLSDITAHDDFTHITVWISSQTADVAEAMMHTALYPYCELYSVFSGKADFDYVIETVNTDGKALKTVTAEDIRRMKERLDEIEKKKSNALKGNTQ